MNIEQIYNYCHSLPNVVEEFPFGEDILVFKVCNKIFFLCFLEAIPLRINLKCNPELALQLREEYDGIIVEGYHMNKKHWNTIFTENISNEMVKNLIIHSYEEVLKKLPLKTCKELKYTFVNPFSEN